MPKYRTVALRLLSYIIVALVAVMGTAIYDRIPRDKNICVSDLRLVSQNRWGDKVRMRDVLCGGIAYSDVVKLELQRKGGGHASEFFVYQRNSSDPTIAWPTKNLLSIQLGDVGHVYKKLDEMNGMKIQYRIGSP